MKNVLKNGAFGIRDLFKNGIPHKSVVCSELETVKIVISSYGNHWFIHSTSTIM